jgi:hypothetical protein
MCPIPRPSLESGLSQHPLGFFQGELRVVDQYDCEQFGPYLSETKQLRLPAFTIGGIGVHARRVGPGGGARQAINSGLVNASAGGSTMFASCCLADRVDRWHGRGDLHRSHWGGVDDLEAATAAYKAAPGEPVTLREGTGVMEDSRQNRVA